MSESSDFAEPTAKPRRLLIRLCVVAVALLVIALLGYNFSQRRQGQTESWIAKLRIAGGSPQVTTIGPDFLKEIPPVREFLPQRIVGAHFIHKTPRSKEPPAIEVTDEQLLDLFNNPSYSMTRFKYLVINSRKISDDGLECIDNLPRLTWLELINTTVTIESFERLKNLHDLEILHIWGSSLDDAGLDVLVSSIQDRTGLRQLKLENTQITDAGLVHLRRLQSIPKLLILISESDVSEEAVKELKKYVRKSIRIKP